MIIDFDIKFCDDKGNKYRWVGGTIIRIADGRLVDLDKNEYNEQRVLEIKENLNSLLELGE